MRIQQYMCMIQISLNLQIEGETWRRARHASTPVFTSGKMKKMSKMMKKVADDLLAQLDKFAATGEEVDGKDLSFKYTGKRRIWL